MTKGELNRIIKAKGSIYFYDSETNKYDNTCNKCFQLVSVLKIKMVDLKDDFKTSYLIGGTPLLILNGKSFDGTKEILGELDGEA